RKQAQSAACRHLQCCRPPTHHWFSRPRAVILPFIPPSPPSRVMSRYLLPLVIAGLLVAVVALPGGSPPRLAWAVDHPIPEPLKQLPPSKFESRWADTGVTIDGTADEDAWKHAEEIDAFHLPWLGDKARMSRTKTTAKLL